MKLLLVLVGIFAFANARSFQPEIPEYNTAYGYLKNYGIPAAERIRKAEEEYQNGHVRIVGGSAARLGQFPWQAGLISRIVGTSGRGVCGASLIAASRLLTAAHCWYDGQNQAAEFTVVLGSTTIFSGGTRIESSQVITHNNWNPSLVRNDVAIIYLPRAAPLSNTIAVIALPSGSEVNENFVGSIATASGFGLTKDNGQISTNQVLSHVSLEVITNSVCSRSFPLILQSSNICTSGAGGVGTCQGDSGGPLTVVRNNRPILIGVTSFGSARGCERNQPAAFARVTSFLSFIRQHM